MRAAGGILDAGLGGAGILVVYLRSHRFLGSARHPARRFPPMPAGRGVGGAAAVLDAAGFEPLVSGFIRRVFVAAVVSVSAHVHNPRLTADPMAFGTALHTGGRRQYAGSS